MTNSNAAFINKIARAVFDYEETEMSWEQTTPRHRRLCEKVATHIYDVVLQNNTPTDSNTNLIELMVRHMKDENHLLDYSECQLIIDALESQPFDVLGYLRKGGRAVNANNRIIYQRLGMLQDGLIIWEDEGRTVHPSSLTDFKWQPYHEPPAEGSREWAIEQIAHGKAVTHESWDTDSFTRINSSTEISDTGWSIWKEPRKPGWYSVKQDVAFSVWYWDGEMFCHNDGENSSKQNAACFRWISDKRIELDVPGDESCSTCGDAMDGHIDNRGCETGDGS